VNVPWAKIFEHGVTAVVLVWFMWVTYVRLRALESAIASLAGLVYLLILELSTDKQQTIRDQAERLKAKLDKRNASKEEDHP